MRFDLLDQKAALDVTANGVLMVLLVAKANHAAIDLLGTALRVIVLHVMAKVDHRAKVKAVVLEMAKVDHLKDVIRDVDEAMALQVRGPRAVRWARRLLNDSWKTRCVSMLMPMAS